MTVAPYYSDELVPAGATWLPTRHTPPLTDDPARFVTDGDRLIKAVESLWIMPDGSRLKLDGWQKWLLRCVLERYPADWHVPELRGRLRFRQVVVSMGRQNGKSVLGAVLALYGLAMHVPGPEVIGLASSVDQANIIYARVRHVIKENPVLARRFKQTGTRGISARSGSGSYRMKPAKEDALQGIPVTCCLFDELHICDMGMWSAVVKGQRAQPNGIVVGITTAGDDDSELLKHLYKAGEQSVAGDLERFGFFCWEAPEGATIDTPGAIEAANPAVACGRLDVNTVRDDERLTPEADQLRYTLNRFVSSSSAWLPSAAWRRLAGGGIVPGTGAVWFTFERTASWEHASIAATVKDETTGRLTTELVASVVDPNLDQLLDLAGELRKWGPATFAVDALRLGALGKQLEQKGFEVRMLRAGDAMQAGPAAFSLIMGRRVAHAGDPLLTDQMPKARRKNVGEGWRISAADSSGDVDAVLATVYGLYLADSTRDPGIQIF